MKYILNKEESDKTWHRINLILNNKYQSRIDDVDKAIVGLLVSIDEKLEKLLENKND